MNRQKIADDLHRYLVFRAKQEGLRCDLTPEFFLDALRHGVTCFFGITVDASGLEADEQNPEAFAKWMALY